MANLNTMDLIRITLIALAVSMLWFVLHVLGTWQLFRKAGKPAWRSIIPVLNIYDLFDIAWSGGMGVLFLLAVIADVGITAAGRVTALPSYTVWIQLALSILIIILALVMIHRLSKSFQRGFGTTLGLLFLPTLFRIILGYGAAVYAGPYHRN